MPEIDRDLLMEPNLEFWRRGHKHQTFAHFHPDRRLECGLDIVKALSVKGVSDIQIIARMVELYDDLLGFSEMALLWKRIEMAKRA